MWNPLSWAMEVAAILSIVLLDYSDFALILFLLLLNASIQHQLQAPGRPTFGSRATLPTPLTPSFLLSSE